MSFSELGIKKQALNQQLKEMGFLKPTLIQQKTIPLLIEGSDVIAQAQTGSGKTLAFALPILEKVNIKAACIQALIVAPTRELALQITSEMKQFTANLEGVNILAVYGGQDVEQQIHKLADNIHIVIGTPGRLLDHVRRGTIDLSTVSMLVLDEADQMLHMGFINEVSEVIEQTLQSRQTMLFSATMPKQIKMLASEYMNEPKDIRAERTKDEVTLVSSIRQLVVETTDRAKQHTLFALLEKYEPNLAIIFCRTKRRAAKLNEAMQERRYLSAELHGDLSQARREQVMKDFREWKVQLLVATDVAARGLDVEGVTHIFNYDIPTETESYIHRIGRTGRAGEKGMAITLVAPKDKSYLAMIEKDTNQTLERMEFVQQSQTQNNAKRKNERTSERRSPSPFPKEKRTKPRLRRR